MARKEIYRIKSKLNEPNHWVVEKADLDFNPVKTYEVSKTGIFYNCDCFAGNKEVCRHRTMVLEFEVEQKIDTHWWFEFDKGRWIEGPKNEL